MQLSRVVLYSDIGQCNSLVLLRTPSMHHWEDEVGHLAKPATSLVEILALEDRCVGYHVQKWHHAPPARDVTPHDTLTAYGMCRLT